MKINEAVILESNTKPIDMSFFFSKKDRVVVYQKEDNKKDQIIHVVRKGKHEFINKKGSQETKLGTVSQSDRAGLDQMYQKIDSEYKLQPRPKWPLILPAVLSIPVLSAAIRRIFKSNTQTPTDPLDKTTVGLDAQHMREIDPTVDVSEVPSYILDRIVDKSVNRYGYLDLNDLRTGITDYLSNAVQIDPTTTVIGWDLLKKTLDALF